MHHDDVHLGIERLEGRQDRANPGLRTGHDLDPRAERDEPAGGRKRDPGREGDHDREHPRVLHERTERMEENGLPPKLHQRLVPSPETLTASRGRDRHADARAGGRLPTFPRTLTQKGMSSVPLSRPAWGASRGSGATSSKRVYVLWK